MLKGARWGVCYLGLRGPWGPWRPGAERTLICRRWSEWFNIRPLMDSEQRMSRPRTGFPRRSQPVFPGRRRRRARGRGASWRPCSVAVRSQNAFEHSRSSGCWPSIKLGVVHPGERFQPERELAAQHGVSRITLREAIGDLPDAGYVESRRSRFGGTFVTYTPPAPSRVDLRRGRGRGRSVQDQTTRSPSRMTVESGCWPRSWPSSARTAVIGPRCDALHGRDGRRPGCSRPG